MKTVKMNMVMIMYIVHSLDKIVLKMPRLKERKEKEGWWCIQESYTNWLYYAYKITRRWTSFMPVTKMGNPKYQTLSLVCLMFDTKKRFNHQAMRVLVF